MGDIARLGQSSSGKKHAGSLVDERYCLYSVARGMCIGLRSTISRGRCRTPKLRFEINTMAASSGIALSEGLHSCISRESWRFWSGRLTVYVPADSKQDSLLCFCWLSSFSWPALEFVASISAFPYSQFKS